MRHSGIVSVLALLGALAIPSLAGAQVESTPIPQTPKPNLSPLSYLVGTWSCSTQSARRPAPFKTTVTYVMEPTGYWINEKSVTEPMSWFPAGLTSYDKITYDPQEKHWIDLSYDERGGYGYSVSQPGSRGDKVVWHGMTGVTGNPSIATNSDTTMMHDGNSKLTSSSSFTEKSGRNVSVVSTCTKQS